MTWSYTEANCGLLSVRKESGMMVVTRNQIHSIGMYPYPISPRNAHPGNP